MTERVIGVDPGLGTTGYAVIEPAHPGFWIIEAGVIRSGDTSLGLPERLKRLHLAVVEVLQAFHPDALALEQVHSQVRHPRTAILMAHARGVIMLAAGLQSLPVHGYAPSRIKKNLTGNGRASKDQMQTAIRNELGLDRIPEPHDVADACAVALCHLHTSRLGRALGLLSSPPPLHD